MSSILNWYPRRGRHLQGAARVRASTSRRSARRSSRSTVRGTASGPVSFMRGADASAGTIKSGGKTRRAAKMVILDVDHPDVEEFVWCKVKEERKARVLRDAGFDMDLDGTDSFSIQYQNANNSVRVTDEFMQAVVEDADWGLKAVTSGEIVKTVRARDLWRQIAQASWGVRRPRSPVRHHDQQVAHGSHDRSHQRLEPVLGVHAPRQHRRATWPRSTCSSTSTKTARSTSTPTATRSRWCSPPRRSSVGRADLPDRADRRHQPQVPPARHRLRQPRRPPDGARLRLRLARRSCMGRVAHLAHDRPLVRHERPHRGPDGPVRGLR